MKRIGMRNLKTAIAVFLCIIITRKLNVSDSPFYACIAAVICMQSSVFETFKTGKNRMIGTFIGALIGFLFALIQPGNAMLVAVGIILLIYVCNVLGYNKSISIACIVFIAIMVNLTDKTPLFYSTYRLIETFIGILIAVLVNYFIYPPKYLDNLHQLRLDIINALNKLSHEKLFDNKDVDLSTLNKQISALENLMKSYIEEIIPKKNTSNKIADLQKVLKLSKKAYSHLFMLNSLNSVCFLNEKNLLKAKLLFGINEQASTSSNSDLDIVYNYHIENLFNILETLKSSYENN
ncbi:FUSC family protein [Clostridium bovifaecis]|uniref:FUSC family protein n=1 Tax=Clostridium bovifaecis TaxID=2184719 RepID=A0A6I6F506_9CLOT|nr:FUSC family protein [Clostridium bovifaecis]